MELLSCFKFFLCHCYYAVYSTPSFSTLPFITQSVRNMFTLYSSIFFFFFFRNHYTRTETVLILRSHFFKRSLPNLLRVNLGKSRPRKKGVQLKHEPRELRAKDIPWSAVTPLRLSSEKSTIGNQTNL